MNGSEKDRFRSFAERYIVERASTFELGREREQAFMAILDARTIYQRIEQESDTVSRQMQYGEESSAATQGGAVGRTPQIQQMSKPNPARPITNKGPMTNGDPVSSIDAGSWTGR